jgi:hypothetical protein
VGGCEGTGLVARAERVAAGSHALVCPQRRIASGQVLPLISARALKLSPPSPTDMKLPPLEVRRKG